MLFNELPPYAEMIGELFVKIRHCIHMKGFPQQVDTELNTANTNGEKRNDSRNFILENLNDSLRWYWASSQEHFAFVRVLHASYTLNDTK